MPDNNNSIDKTKFIPVKPISIDKELKASFLDYAMSVIVSRALPDIRDGLKPVHRRILYAMHNMGLYKERAYKKSAAVVGEVMSKYHPHGDSAIYQTMVGLVQNFSKRYPILDGQGNWGSVDGDNAAAMRYTEVRMERLARDILCDIEKNTVRFVPNFDESCMEPTVLPSRIPQLLLNGSNGIAVGMATAIPPHNLTEVVSGCLALLKNPDITDNEIFQHIPAPDFPGGGIICGLSSVRKAYKTGHGSAKLRGVVEEENVGNKETLVIVELPYQVNKADFITKIFDLVKNKIIDGITNIRDESARNKMRIVIDIKKGEIGKVVLNQLFKHTNLETTIPMILLAICDQRPAVFTLREMLEQFIYHRRTVVTRRSEFELAKHKAKAHLLIGITKAIENIDAVVKTIKTSKSSDEASAALQSQYQLSPEQAKAILEMRLNKITNLETDKIKDEVIEIRKAIAVLESILNCSEKLDGIITEELEKIKESYGDARRSRIEMSEETIDDIDLIPNDDVVITITQKGYIKRVKMENYAVQHRGGRGKKGSADLSEYDDFIQDAFVARNHDNLLFFTSKGRVFSQMVFKIPEGSRIARGRAVVNILPLTEGETILKLLPTRDIENKFIFMITRNGVIKKTTADAFKKVRSTGIIALDLRDGDELAFCGISSGNDTVIVATDEGQGIRFQENEVRAMGRQAAGVKGINTSKSDAKVVGLEIIAENTDCSILFATSRGYGKQVLASDFRIAHRGGLGVRTIPVDKRNGQVIGMIRIDEGSSLLLLDKAGKIIRLNPDEIRTMRRGAKGVRLIKLDATQTLSSVIAFKEKEEVEEPEVVTPAPTQSEIAE